MTSGWGPGLLKLTRVAIVALALIAPILAAPAFAAVPNAYVALGDSYTAGPFIPAPTGDPIDCGQSTNNYPHLVAAAMKAPVLHDVSCGSATTSDMTHAQTGLPLGGTNPPQFSALNSRVGLVTVGIGGNDVGFGGAASNCAERPPPPIGKPCKGDYVHNGHDEISDKIKAAAPRIAAVLAGIHKRAPRASVFLVGYPALMPEDNAGCYPYVPVNPADVPWIRAKNKELNAMLRTQANKGRATYVDWYTPSIGHDMCKPPTIAWTNAIVVVPPSYPAHPNSYGEVGASVAVLKAIKATHFSWRR